MAKDDLFGNVNLYDALDNNSFRVSFQPQIHLVTGQVIGACALSRYFAEDGRVILPSEYLAKFEEDGFIKNLDFFVFEEVCKLQSKWTSYFGEGLFPMPISINFSRTWFNERYFIPALEGLIGKYGVKPELIEIEISELGAIKSPESFARVFRELKRIGFRCSVDYFGKTGITTPLIGGIDADTLKVSRECIAMAKQYEESRKRFSEVVTYAEDLGMDVVAVGAESESDLKFLSDLGCRCVQGFIFAEPLPKAMFISFVKERE